MKYKAGRSTLLKYPSRNKITTGTLSNPLEAGIFGPSSLPFFYTGLKSPPKQFQWQDAGKDESLQYLELLEFQNSSLRSVFSGQVLNRGKLDLEPSLFEFRSDLMYAWTIGKKRLLNSKIDNGTGKERNNSIPISEGSFWILNKQQSSFIEETINYFRAGDETYDHIAIALLLAEKQLYQDAILLCENVAKNDQRPGRMVITNYVQAIIYRYMKEHAQNQNEQFAACLPLDRYIQWMENREKYHRSLVSEQINKRLTTN